MESRIEEKRAEMNRYYELWKRTGKEIYWHKYAAAHKRLNWLKEQRG